MSALCSTNGRLVTSFFLSTNSNSCCYLWKRLAKFIKVWSKFPWTRLRCFWVPFLEPWLYYDGYFMGQMLRSGKTESFVMSSEFTKRKSLASQFFIWTLECIFPASISHFDGQNLPKTSENPLHNLQAQYRLICGVLLSRFSRGRLGRARDGRNASTVRFFFNIYHINNTASLWRPCRWFHNRDSSQENRCAEGVWWEAVAYRRCCGGALNT